MLNSLAIRDFAIIKALEVDLRKGFSVITGETGAGKSIIIEAVSLALGARADTSYVRTGAAKASVELTAETDDPDVLAMLAENGIDDGGTLLISREITSAGKSFARINGTPVTIGFLNGVAKRLCDIHGQYEHQALLDPETHIDYLDAFAPDDLRSVKATVASLFETYADLTKKIDAYEKARAESARKRDFMRFELDEITKAAPGPTEDEDLEAELLLLKNSETIYENLTNARLVLAEDEGDASSRLSSAVQLLDSVRTFSPALSELAERLESLSYELDDVARCIRRESESVTYSEERLNEIQDRLETLGALKRKYGPTLADVLSYAEKLRADLSLAESAGTEAEGWKADRKIAEDQLRLASSRLSRLRRETARSLEREMERELSELNFQHARFSVAFSETPLPFSANGTDAVEFLLSANKGEDLKPLARVASGGELSRVMLAFKGIAGKGSGRGEQASAGGPNGGAAAPTMIFDEIDQGISGITASVVAKKLRALSKDHQIIAITHLPQIAAAAGDHLRIVKGEMDDRTVTTLERLDEPGRVAEIARLLGGLNVTDATVVAARDLLSASRADQ
jgi:DNA repair protein RecN (Recombination protein N)